MGKRVYEYPGGPPPFTGATNWESPADVPPSLVSSVFGRIGNVIATLGDYAASLVSNDSTVPGATVADAFDALLALILAIPAAPVSSVFGRIGAVVGVLGDYAASLVTNNSTVPGATVQAALNALNSPTNNWRYVSQNGSDVTGTGTLQNPWASVTFAMSQITTASVTARFTIWVMGRVTEPAGVVLKPNVFIAGVSPQNSRVSATSWTIDAAWTPAGDFRTGFVNCTVNGPITLDFNAFSANEGKLYLQGVWVNSALTLTRFSNINQLFCFDSVSFATWTFHGCAVTMQANFLQGNVVFDEGPGAGQFTLQSIGDAFLGTLQLTKVAAAGDAATLLNSSVAALTVAGTLSVQATMDAIPAAPSLSGGATIQNLTVPRTAGTASARWLSGNGTPNGAVLGSVGDLFSRLDGGAVTSFYVKESGANTNTGWVAK